MNIKNFNVVEGTTHYINIDCVHDDSNEKFYLEGYEVVFWLRTKNNDVIKKEVTTIDNTISVKLEPEETRGKDYLTYECRILAINGDIFHVATGKIKIVKPKIPVNLLVIE